ncbi:MAG: class I SAM-dependent methyltransferase [Methylomonas sp.]|nr:class I SAM-dependent methyltransferase [Methylomonas sp.]PPD20130.1 MAG: SAM-dependent methyltransferase [Methylomonas sp.]PPD24442.1 MAG: SAM-dependent methyltransferase [Methylomonas sp.]PPD32983.1 MAG: SAM-dependent methyltransferase [Methylomonas sp.]PPD52147.1 MAG: SAM-dependent methyltransferase [Methylomonas sp.]
MTHTAQQYDALFSGLIGQDYDMLKLICPFAAEMSRLVGQEVGALAQQATAPFAVIELGGGTGITTLAILSADPNLTLLSIDNEPTMQNQAKAALGDWVEQGRLTFALNDALSALTALPDASSDIIASAYTLHNFEATYRQAVLQQCHRVLKPGGHFINGDRYALDDIDAHTRNTQREVASYFKVLTEITRLDLLEHWIIHLFSDESENHIMREGIALQQMREAGFTAIDIKLRQDVNALLTATRLTTTKPTTTKPTITTP